jgi:hypothetical protein
MDLEKTKQECHKAHPDIEIADVFKKDKRIFLKCKCLKDNCGYEWEIRKEGFIHRSVKPLPLGMGSINIGA